MWNRNEEAACEWDEYCKVCSRVLDQACRWCHDEAGTESGPPDESGETVYRCQNHCIEWGGGQGGDYPPCPQREDRLTRVQGFTKLLRQYTTIELVSRGIIPVYFLAMNHVEELRVAWKAVARTYWSGEPFWLPEDYFERYSAHKSEEHEARTRQALLTEFMVA